MLIKPKSLVVALVSSSLIALVLVVTLATYLLYIEMKGRESEASYRKLLAEIRSRAHSGQRINP